MKCFRHDPGKVCPECGLDRRNYTIISRKLLTEAHDLLRKHFPQMKNVHMIGWTYKTSDHYWKFHINGWTWHGKAANAYDARYQGWMAWLKHKGVKV